jgi:2-polyprenyl-6-methoxyphenol hydroxylase-like FAD-dependent oxidoreductase
MTKTVLVVGGGPVGLMLAHFITSLDRSAHVDIIEKRKSYKREQIVVLTKHSIDQLPIQVRRSVFGIRGKGCYIKSPPTDQIGKCYMKRPKDVKLGSVVLKHLEMVLRNHLLASKSNRIRMVNREVTPEYLRQHAHQYDCIVGADGNSSTVRRWMDIKSSTRHAGYGAALTFNDPTPTRIIKEKTETKTNKEVPQHRFRGFRSRGGLNYYIAIQLMGTEYQQLRNVRRLTGASVSMQDTVVEAASFYGMNLPPFNSVSVNAFPIKVRIARSASKQMTKTTKAFLVGDAYMSVHFFSGLGVNYGIDGAVHLARVITGHASKQTFTRHMKEMSRVVRTTLKNISIPKSIHDRDLSRCMNETSEELSRPYNGMKQLNRCMVLYRKKRANSNRSRNKQKKQIKK